MARGGAGGLRGEVGFLYLAEDFGFADDHALESADDAEEMARAFVAAVLLKGVGRQASAGGDEIGDQASPAAGVFGCGVVFDAIAGGNDDGFPEAFEAGELGGHFPEAQVADGELLAKLDRGGLMAEA